MPGPIEPMTKRGRSGVENCSHASRAARTAAALISAVRPSSPNSRRTCGIPPKVFVSTASQPTARNEAWIERITSGRLTLMISQQFSSPP